MARFALALMLLLLLGWPACAAPPAVYEATGSEDRVPLGPWLQSLEVPGGGLARPDAPPPDGAWQPVPTGTLQLGITRSDWWLRARLANPGDSARTLVVDLGSARQEHLRWLLVDAAGQVRIDRETGDRLPRETRPIASRGVALPVALAAHEQVELFVRIRSHDGMIEPLPVSVSTLAAFQREQHVRDLLSGLYGGGLVALVLYNLFLYLSTRSREFLAYVTYGVGLLGWNITYFGLGFEFFWPDAPVLNHRLVLTFAALGYAGMAWFVPTYLRLDALPGFGRVRQSYRLAQIAFVLVALVALADHQTPAGIAAIALGSVLMCGSLALSAWLAWRGRRQAVFLALALLALVVGLGLYYLQLFGVLPQHGAASWALQIGAFVEMLLLAFGVADSMNALKAEKLAAERRAHEAQRALTHELEHQVAERTGALQEANRRLGELAITDELTGTYNRRHFNRCCDDLVGGLRPGEPWALCMFDIDHFKRFNDHYGHQAGDAVLRDLSAAVAAALRRAGDRLFRLGGEEFAVLFQASTPEQARAFADTLRQAVRALARPHAGSPQGIVTASFGVACWATASGPAAPRKVYADADAALYRAKSGGRDCVVLAEAGADAPAPTPVLAGIVPGGHCLAR